MAEDFQNQTRAWGMTPSFAFVGEPQTNGVVERFFRTLKEQLVHGRVFETLEDLRDVVRAFIARYNAQWLIEKNDVLPTFLPQISWTRSPFAPIRGRGGSGRGRGALE
jgi:putative transposase